MDKESGFAKFRGTIWAIAASVASGIVAVYFLYTFWLGQTIDLNLVAAGKKIPPESYPFLLMAGWSLLQRAKAHARPSEGGYGTFWYWEDRLEAVGMIVFLGLTLFQAISVQSNISFVLVLIGFLVQGFGDMILNGRHRYQASLSESGGGYGDVAPRAMPSDGSENTELFPLHTRLIVEQIGYRQRDGSVRIRTPAPVVIEHEPQPSVAAPASVPTA